MPSQASSLAGLCRGRSSTDERRCGQDENDATQQHSGAKGPGTRYLVPYHYWLPVRTF